MNKKGFAFTAFEIKIVSIVLEAKV